MRLDDFLILDFNCMARIKAFAAVVADSGQPAKALGSKVAKQQIREEWFLHQALRAAVSGIIQISPHGKPAHRATVHSCGPYSCKSFQLPMEVSASPMAWDFAIPIISRQLDLTSHLAMPKSCKESYHDPSMSY